MRDMALARFNSAFLREHCFAGLAAQDEHAADPVERVLIIDRAQTRISLPLARTRRGSLLMCASPRPCAPRDKQSSDCGKRNMKVKQPGRKKFSGEVITEIHGNPADRCNRQ